MQRHPIFCVLILFATAPAIAFGQSSSKLSGKSDLSPESRKRVVEYEVAGKRLNRLYSEAKQEAAKTYEKEVGKLRTGLLADLEVMRKTATTSDKLDDAIGLRNSIRHFEQLSISPPKLSEQQAKRFADLESKIQRLEQKNEARKTPAYGVKTDILKLIDLRWDTIAGLWQQDKKNNSLTNAPGLKGKPRIRVPFRINADYELTWKFIPHSSNDLFLHLPVGDRSALLYLFGGHGKLSGIDNVPGISIHDGNNPTRIVREIESGKEHKINVSVVHSGNQVSVTSLLDGNSFVAWNGNIADLAVGPCTLDLGAVYGTSYTTTELSITLKRMKNPR